MMASTHVVAGVGAWYGVALAAGLPPHHPAALGLAAVGALLPDIDHPGSWVGRRLSLVSVPLGGLLGHRGLTHSLVAVFLAFLGLAFLGLGRHGPALFIAPVLVGYLSHLACDALTPSGVPLLWPHKRPFALPLVRTGSLGEWLLMVLAVLVLGHLLLGHWGWGRALLAHLPPPLR